MIILKVISLAILCAILSFSAKLILGSFKKILRLGGDNFALSSLIIGLGTSIPEFTVAISCALRGKSEVALGNVLGSNIASLSLMIGGATLISGRLKIIDSILKKDVYYTFLISAAPLLLLSDGVLSRGEGFILLLLYLGWQFLAFSGKGKNGNRASFFLPPRPLLVLALGLTILLLATELLVDIAIPLAHQLRVPSFIIGVFILGVGTAIPELTFGIHAVKEKEGEMALGNIFGSLIVNSSLVLGTAALISPVKLFPLRQYFTITLYFLVTFLLFYTFIKTKKTLEKWEAAFLVASYFILLALEFG